MFTISTYNRSMSKEYRTVNIRSITRKAHGNYKNKRAKNTSNSIGLAVYSKKGNNNNNRGKEHNCLYNKGEQNMSNRLVTSPKGDLLFLALNRKVAKSKQKDSPLGYTVRMSFKDTQENKTWKDTITKINPNIIVTKNQQDGTFAIKAFSTYQPEVMDGSGNLLEEYPNFYSDSTGTAQMVVSLYEGDTEGEGCINLAGLILHDINVGEHTGGAEEARAQALATMREALKNK